MRHVAPIPYPDPIPFPRLHRCAHPVVHSLAVASLLVGWLWFSISTRGTWGFKVAAWLDPRKVGYGLPIAVFTELFWLALIPVGFVAVYLLVMWRCTGARAHIQPRVAEAFQAPGMPRPTMIERIVIPDEAAAQRGWPSGTIAERIHYR
jgi:hypothetical protein